MVPLLLENRFPNLIEDILPAFIMYTILFFAVMVLLPEKLFQTYFGSNEVLAFIITYQFSVNFAIDFTNYTNTLFMNFKNNNPLMIIICWIYMT
jgi:hypothetical protein